MLATPSGRSDTRELQERTTSLNIERVQGLHAFFPVLLRPNDLAQHPRSSIMLPLVHAHKKLSIFEWTGDIQHSIHGSDHLPTYSQASCNRPQVSPPHRAKDRRSIRYIVVRLAHRLLNSCQHTIDQSGPKQWLAAGCRRVGTANASWRRCDCCWLNHWTRHDSRWATAGPQAQRAASDVARAPSHAPWEGESGTGGGEVFRVRCSRLKVSVVQRTGLWRRLKICISGLFRGFGWLLPADRLLEGENPWTRSDQAEIGDSALQPARRFSLRGRRRHLDPAGIC